MRPWEVLGSRFPRAFGSFALRQGRRSASAAEVAEVARRPIPRRLGGRADPVAGRREAAGRWGGGRV